MFRYKEAFLDINQFIRDLFVILSSLNASHNNVPRSLLIAVAHSPVELHKAAWILPDDVDFEL